MEIKSLIKKALLNKYLYIILILALIPFFYFTDETTKRTKESKKHTDEFLNLLIDGNYHELYNRHASSSGMDLRKFISSLDIMHRKFGKMKSYSYDGSRLSYSKHPRVLTGLFLRYGVIFENDKHYQCSFSISIDSKSHLPTVGSIEEFTISERDISSEDFILRLIDHYFFEGA